MVSSTKPGNVDLSGFVGKHTTKNDYKQMKTIMMLTFALLAACGTPAQRPNIKFESQANAAFAKTIADSTVQLVDVRTPAEFASGHIPGAVNMDANGAGFSQQAATLDKERPVAVYCRSGARSKRAAYWLAAQGYNVYELNRGISNWDGKITY